MDAAGSSGGDWRPLMRMSLLEAQHHAWRRALTAKGMLLAAGDAAAQRQLSQYLRSGSLACPSDRGVSEVFLTLQAALAEIGGRSCACLSWRCSAMHGGGRSQRRGCSQQPGMQLRRGSSRNTCAAAAWLQSMARPGSRYSACDSLLCALGFGKACSVHSDLLLVVGWAPWARAGPFGVNTKSSDHSKAFTHW